MNMDNEDWDESEAMAGNSDDEYNSDGKEDSFL